MGQLFRRESTQQSNQNFTYQEFVDGLKQKKYNNIVVLTGAGISTSAGIPDFRSKEGLYKQLKEFNLPYPEAVFSIDFFKSDPLPFYKIVRILTAKDYQPTIAHRFIKYLQDQGILHINFTQNVDDLEIKAGIKKEKLIQAHGTFQTAKCIKCGKKFDIQHFLKGIEKENTICKCDKDGCSGLIKPDVVFFGEQLPDEFQSVRSEIKKADLGIIMGTSLQVHPFSSLVTLFKSGIPIVVFNRSPLKISLSNPILQLNGEMDKNLQKIQVDLGKTF